MANLSIQNRGSVPSLTISGDTALFTFSVYQPEAESADQISDGSLAVTVNAIRALCGAMEPNRGPAPEGAAARQDPIAAISGPREVQRGKRCYRLRNPRLGYAGSRRRSHGA